MAANPTATPIVSAAPASVTVDVDTELRNAERFLREDGWPAHADAVALARAAVAELIAKVDALAASLESPTLVRPSTKNENAGFVDMRGWYGLIGNELKQVRAASARCAGAPA